MAVSIREINRKAEQLIEQGKQAEQTVINCQERVSALTNEVNIARMQLETASRTDENGNPVGDVASAQARLAMAQNQLAAGRRALERAQGDVQRINAQKESQIDEINRRNEISRSNLEKLSNLNSMSFSENSMGISADIAERLNEAENARVSLLRSMGKEATPRYFNPSHGSTVSTGWDGGGISSLDLEGQNANANGVDFFATPIAVANNNNDSGETSILGVQKNTNNDSSIDDLTTISSLDDSTTMNTNFDSDGSRLKIKSYIEKNDEYIDKCCDKLKSTLQKEGISDGYVLDGFLAEYKNQYLESCFDNILNGGTYGELPSVDLKAKVNDLNTKAEERKNLRLVYNDAFRDMVRTRIRNGSYDEKDIREIGKNVRKAGTFDVFLKSMVSINSRKVSCAIMLANAKTQADIDRVKLCSSIIIEMENNILKKCNYSNMNRFVSEFRSVGPKSMQKYEYGSSLGQSGWSNRINSIGKVVTEIENARKNLPTDWVEKENDKPIRPVYDDRGYFWAGKDVFEICLSDRKGCSYHEYGGHRTETVFPEVVAIEKSFYERRTTLPNGKREELKWMGVGYDNSEVTRRDHFINPYIGKDYGGSAYEIVSMGMDCLYNGRYNIFNDSEHLDLMLGILVSV